MCVCVGERGVKGERERGMGDRVHICSVRQLRYSFSAGNIRKRF